MEKYYKEENGIKKWFKNSVILNNMRIFNPTEEQILEAGYIKYVAPTPIEPTQEELLAQAIINKISALHNYDASGNINICYITYKGQTVSYWADKNERSSLRTAIQDYMKAGHDTYRLDLRKVGISVDIPCENLLNMLSALEVYAVDCYNKTTDHEFAIKALSTIEEVKSYKFIDNGYPEKLTFNLE